ncbi:hypothetical protein [Candidatus Poriferisodalis sp.]|uniref:hypothetical protein n=1 Tax=Candidatus Poriferisodalis sp. TaxID=3101277 RepID=UPI003AF634DD
MAPTSTWVIFEEAEPEAPRWTALDSVRVPQADADLKGAGFWLDWSYFPSARESDEDFDGDGKITVAEAIVPWLVQDLCAVDTDEVDSGNRWLLERVAQAECPGRGTGIAGDVVRCVRISADGTREPCLEPIAQVDGEGRWLVIDDAAEGVFGQTYRTRREALNAAARDRDLRTLPVFAKPLGLLAWTFGEALDERRYGEIIYSEPASPIDEVRVLPESVAVSGRTLRGLVRNWSRTLWAWGAVVHADDRSYGWPLTIQPGEVAPFEIEDWNGPADTALIEFTVTADLSNDMDLSRGFEIPDLRANSRAYWSCAKDRGPPVPDDHDPEGPRPSVVPPEVLDDFPPEVAQEGCLFEVTGAGMLRGQPSSGAAHVGLSGPSHPSVEGRLAPGLISDLRAYYVRFDRTGHAIELVQATPYTASGGYLIDGNGDPVFDDDGDRIEMSAEVLREFPPRNRSWASVDLLLDIDAFSEDFLLWIGGAHFADD